MTCILRMHNECGCAPGGCKLHRQVIVLPPPAREGAFTDCKLFARAVLYVLMITTTTMYATGVVVALARNETIFQQDARR